MYKSSVQDLVVKLRPEAKLLICCARMLMDSTHAGRIRDLVREEIDWAYLISLAFAHRVVPLLYWNLKTTCPNDVPPTTMGQLQNHFQANAQRNLVLTKDLVKLLNLFKAHNIPTLPFKGPVLAATVYSNLALRQFGDLDILVHQQDVQKAKDLLISQGYEQLHLPTLYEYHYHFVHNNDYSRHVELHWRATMRHFAVPLDLEYFWKRLKPLFLAGETIPCFPPEDLLIILCLHGAKHHWSRLSWICDVAELLHRYQTLDWERIKEQANRLGGERILYLGLFLTSGLLEAPIPPEIRSKVQADFIVKSLAAQVSEWLFLEDDILYARLKRYEFYLQTKGYWQAKFAYWLHLTRQKAFPNVKDQAFLPLPASLSLLYYLLRPIRLVKEYGLSRARLTYLLRATIQDFREA